MGTVCWYRLILTMLSVRSFFGFWVGCQTSSLVLVKAPVSVLDAACWILLALKWAGFQSPFIFGFSRSFPNLWEWSRSALIDLSEIEKIKAGPQQDIILIYNWWSFWWPPGFGIDFSLKRGYAWLFHLKLRLYMPSAQSEAMYEDAGGLTEYLIIYKLISDL